MLPGKLYCLPHILLNKCRLQPLIRPSVVKGARQLKYYPTRFNQRLVDFPTDPAKRQGCELRAESGSCRRLLAYLGNPSQLGARHIVRSAVSCHVEKKETTSHPNSIRNKTIGSTVPHARLTAQPVFRTVHMNSRRMHRTSTLRHARPGRSQFHRVPADAPMACERHVPTSMLDETHETDDGCKCPLATCQRLGRQLQRKHFVTAPSHSLETVREAWNTGAASKVFAPHRTPSGLQLIHAPPEQARATKGRENDETEIETTLLT
ncbi:hypothetical protein B0T26DRAFT_418142 [Lasiosphaeria miniovina]|uniref:Uncharacterized protein n=1 Tax=Lasiosphaeria miniovina TaxID=1954250 RepID=A0AA40A5M0_9PEZI|nr:uncharacterized protein B0T26DRAFT_418142 [Lasiosphaeria miniovina]KAK0709692.1 hypothetical protein B0T26DRAFT_418142 [Lasiosphaeria miniovina]